MLTDDLAHQRAELEMLVEGQRRLLEVSRSVLASLDPAEVLELIADSLSTLVPHDSLGILEADWATRTFHPVFSRASFIDSDAKAAFMHSSVSVNTGLAGWVLRHGEPLNVADANTDARGILVPGTPMHTAETAVFVPFVSRDTVSGVLALHRAGESVVAFSQAEFDLVQLFASLASIALQNAQAHRAVVFAADTDALTGLFNHGAFQRDLRALVERAPAEPFALLLLDLDRFKAYNDTRGHPAGDDLLRRVADAIRASSRESDRAYRYGGDEFAVLLRGADDREAQAVASRVAEAIAGITAGKDVEVTASVGSACWPGDATSAEYLLAVADAGIYAVKGSRGGHRVR